MENYLFDFDGTLADSGKTAVVATQKAFLDLGLAAPKKEAILGYMGIPIESSFVLLGAKDLPKADLNELFERFRAHYQANENEYVTLFPGVKDVLAQLVSAKKQLFVVSSKHSEALARNLEFLGIAKYITDLVGSDNVKNYKPAPDGIELLVERYTLAKTQSVMIGDAIYDIEMGQNAQVKTAGALWGAHDPQAVIALDPTFALKDPKQLLTLP